LISDEWILAGMVMAVLGGMERTGMGNRVRAKARLCAEYTAETAVCSRLHRHGKRNCISAATDSLKDPRWTLIPSVHDGHVEVTKTGGD
jgi:hypothetical protein